MTKEEKEHLEWVEKKGPKAKGKKEYVAFLKGKELTPMQAILANCYECTGYYIDNRKDCKSDYCPFHPFMYYREDKTKKKSTRKPMTDEQKKAMVKRFAESRAKI